MNQDEALKRYEETLEIPPRKLKRQIIVCPIGTVGSGKTSVIKPLSKKLSLLRISNDDIRKLLKENGCGYDSVRKLAYRLALKYIAKGFSIAIDGDCNSREAQRHMQELRRKYGIKVFWLHINPPEAFIIHKLKNYKHTWLFKDADEAIRNYYSSKATHENLNFPFVYVFDPSRDDLNKQIEEAATVIKKGIHSKQ